MSDRVIDTCPCGSRLPLPGMNLWNQAETWSHQAELWATVVVPWREAHRVCREAWAASQARPAGERVCFPPPTTVYTGGQSNGQ